MKPLVIYHSPCADGFTAAWAVWKAHPDWEFYPAKYGEAPPDVSGRDVYMLDFSYKRPVVLEMATFAKSITILDHHKTAEAELKDIDSEGLLGIKVFFDMDKSGARLAWEYFHPLALQIPKIVTYVEDRDLWRFTQSATRPVNSYIFSHAYTFENWDDIADHIEYYENNIIDQGNAIERKHFKDIDELASNQFRAIIAGYNVPVINVPYTLASDMCNKLAVGEPFAVSFYYDGSRGKLIFSLRSAEDGIDVSEVAKQFCGGGHKHAAGFEIKTNFRFSDILKGDTIESNV
jgi:uncharacterized protein